MECVGTPKDLSPLHILASLTAVAKYSWLGKQIFLTLMLLFHWHLNGRYGYLQVFFPVPPPAWDGSFQGLQWCKRDIFQGQFGCPTDASSRRGDKVEK